MHVHLYILFFSVLLTAFDLFALQGTIAITCGQYIKHNDLHETNSN